MISVQRRRGEEGQVYPALLLAVIGVFALAVTFLPVQEVLDQNNRADTAADGAALALAKAQKEEMGQVGAISAPTVMPALLGHLSGRMMPMSGWTQAQSFAKANGADLTAAVPLGFDPSLPGWRWEVSTRQRDTVKGGDVRAHSKSRAVVVAEVTAGLCAGGSGFIYGGACIDPVTWSTSCYNPYYQPPYCTEWEIGPTLRWNIRLTANR